MNNSRMFFVSSQSTQHYLSVIWQIHHYIWLHGKWICWVCCCSCMLESFKAQNCQQWIWEERLIRTSRFLFFQTRSRNLRRKSSVKPWTRFSMRLLYSRWAKFVNCLFSPMSVSPLHKYRMSVTFSNVGIGNNRIANFIHICTCICI